MIPKYRVANSEKNVSYYCKIYFLLCWNLSPISANNGATGQWASDKEVMCCFVWKRAYICSSTYSYYMAWFYSAYISLPRRLYKTKLTILLMFRTSILRCMVWLISCQFHFLTSQSGQSIINHQALKAFKPLNYMPISNEYAYYDIQGESM